MTFSFLFFVLDLFGHSSNKPLFGRLAFCHKTILVVSAFYFFLEKQLIAIWANIYLLFTYTFWGFAP